MLLIFSKRFSSFFAVQFLGALNDNIFRIAFSTVLTYYASSLNVVNNSFYSYILSALFILPFLIFSNICGQLADKYAKYKIILWVKYIEIIVMLLASVGLYYKNIYILYVCVFILGLHSTLFGPVKYSYLAEHFNKNELIKPNAWVEMSTFLAILCGSIFGSLLAKFSYNSNFINLIALVCSIIAILGYGLAKLIPQTPASMPSLNISYAIFSLQNMQIILQHKILYLATLAISWLWFIGVVFLNSFFAYSKDILHGDESILTLLLALFSIGIGAGSLCCERLSKNYIELGLVTFGALGISIFTFDLYYSTNFILKSYSFAKLNTFTTFIQNIHNWRVILDFFMISFCAGIFSVPLYAIMQAYSPPQYRSRVIAMNNIINAIFMIISSVFGAIYLGYLGYSLNSFYLLIGILNLCVVFYILKNIPTQSLRLVMVIIIRLFYRLKVKNLEHIPHDKGIVLACNHVSFMDALIIGASIKKPVRFIMDANIANMPLLKYIFKFSKVIPVSTGFENKELLRGAYSKINQALKNNEIICIFPEGEITRNGEVNPLKAGINKIIKSNPQALIIPLAIGGMWGSSFSRIDGRAFKNPLRRGIFNKVYLDIGQPISFNEFNLHDLRRTIINLRRDI